MLISAEEFSFQPVCRSIGSQHSHAIFSNDLVQRGVVNLNGSILHGTIVSTEIAGEITQFHKLPQHEQPSFR